MSKTAKFRQVDDVAFDGTAHETGDVEIVLSHIEAVKALAGCTLVLLQGGNGLYVRETVAEVRAMLEAA